MSLNFYSEIDSLQVTNKDEVVIKIKTSGSNLDKQIDELRTLKNDGAVRIMIESAVVHYTVQKDIETGEDVTTYEKDTNGVWQSKPNGQSALNLGLDQVINQDEDITADIVDKFLIQEKYENESGFNVRQALLKISDGFTFDDIAKDMKLKNTTELVKKLNEARMQYAPMARVWFEESNKQRKAE